MTRRTLALLCLLSSAALAAETDSLLKNSAMAITKGKPAGWRFIDFRTGGKPLVTTDAGRDGSSAVGVDVAQAKQRGAWSQNIKLKGQRFLKVQGYYRTDGLKRARDRGATVRMSYRRGAKPFWGDHRFYFVPSSEWKAFEFVDDVIGQAVYVEVELFNFFAPGQVWFDDVTCRVATVQDFAAMAKDRFDKPPTAKQVGYAPVDRETLTFTPPAFRCVPVRGVKAYRFQCSTQPDFPADATRSYESDLCIYTPHETLPAGQYCWRYGFDIEGVTVWSRVRSFTIQPKPMEFPRPTVEQVAQRIPQTRPRVYLTPELVASIRKGEPKVLADAAGSITRGTKRYIGNPVYPEPLMLPKERTARGDAYLNIFRTMRPFTGGMERCALAYALTGDKTAGAEAKRRLMHYMTWDPKGSTDVRHNDEPAMDLAMRGPRTFDWIADLLTDEEKQKCYEVFRVRLGRINQMHRRMPFETHPFASHAGRMVPFVVEGAIVFYHEIPEAKDWLEYTLHLMWNSYPAWGSADGGWHEGPGYWGAYIGMMTRNVYGFGEVGQEWKRKPFFQNTGYFGLYGVPAFARQHPFGDGHGGGVGRGQARILYGLASLHNNPYFRWYAEVQGARSAGDPERFAAYRPDLMPKPPVDIPQSRVFPNIGLVGFHSDLADPKGNVQMVFKSDPYGSVSHNHASQNAFAINAFGEALAISSGHYQKYGCPHHAQWTWETRAHNAILIDGKGQRKRSPLSKGRIARYWNDDDVTYAMGDATAAYDGLVERAHRHVVFLRPDVFVIVDDLAAPQPVTAQWLLHARTQIAVDEKTKTATITSGDARLDARLLVPEKLTFSQTDEFPVAPYRPNSPNQWHLTVSTVDKSAAPRFLAVLRAHRAGQSDESFRLRKVNVQGFLAVEVESRSSSDTVAVKLADGPAESEAVMVARYSPDGRTLRSFMAYGARTVELAEGVVLRSDQPVSMCGQYGGRDARLIVEASQPAKCALRMPAAYGKPALPQGVQLVSRTKDTVTLAVSAGRHEVVFPLAQAPAVEPVQVTGAGLKEPIAMTPTVGSHVTAWLARTDDISAELAQVEVKYAAPKGSRLILTNGPKRREWTAPGGDAVERFRWTMLRGEYPLTLLNEHGMEPRAQVKSIHFAEVSSAAKLRPAEVKGDGVIRMEAEKFASNRGLRNPARTGKYVCSGGLLYGIGDLVTRVDYDVAAPKAGAYTIVFKHAGDRARTALGLEVNGACPCPAAGLFLFQSTGGWGYDKKQWRVQQLCDAAGKPVTLNLKAGVNRVTLLGQGGRMHLDWVALVPVK